MPNQVTQQPAEAAMVQIPALIQSLKPIPAEELRRLIFDLKPFSTKDGSEILAAMITGAIELGKTLSQVTASPNNHVESITFDKIIERTNGNADLARIEKGKLTLGKKAIEQITRIFSRHYPEHLLLVRDETNESGSKQAAAKPTALTAQAAKHLFVWSPLKNQAAESFLHKVVNAAIEKGCLIQDLKLEISGEEKGMLIGALNHSRELAGKTEQCLKFSELEEGKGKKRVTKHFLEVGETLLAFLKDKLGHRRDYANLFS